MKKEGILCFFRRSNEVLLLKVDYGRENNLGLVWGGVSGYIDYGETPEGAAIREIKEELGVVVIPEDLQKKGSVAVSAELTLDVFFVRPPIKKIQPMEKSIKAVKWFSIDDLPYAEMHPRTKVWLPSLLR
jgi:8-oxo-dGTP pyrophosphatase MutT (NUDIX family)